jgi:quinoprotein relay system zinc metallohydrolase 2
MKALLAALLLGINASAVAEPFALTEIAPGNFVHYGSLEERSADNLNDTANIGFIVGERCVAVVDPGGSFAVGERLHGAIRSRTPLPICYVIITHAHPDHFFGAAAFRSQQTTFVGHRNLSRALQQRGKFYLNALTRDLGEAARGSEVVEPQLIVSERVDLDLGGRTLVLTAWPVAHTDNDLTVLDTKTDTLWTGDLLFVQHTPVLDGNLAGFRHAIAQLAQQAPAHYVPGHGRTADTWSAAVAREAHYFAVIADETRAALRKRRTLQEATDSVGLSEAPNWVNYELYHRRNVTAAYTELEWEE